MRAFVEPVDLQDAWVAKLRAIPELVMEMNGDPGRINAYYDVYPDNVSLSAALYKLQAPGLVVAWAGMTPAQFGQVDRWSHQITLYWRTGGDVVHPQRSTGRVVVALLGGKVGDTGHPLIEQHPDSWIPGFNLECPQIFPVQRQQDAEGLDIWETPILHQQF